MKTTPIKWTNEQATYLVKMYADTKSIDIAQYLGKSIQSVYHKAQALGLKKSAEFLQSEMSGRLIGGNRGVSHRYPKGHKPWNTGIKGVCTGGVETQFKKGNRPSNHKPVGSTRVCSKDGYVLIKVAEGKFQWRALHKEVWKQHHGEYPAKGMVVTFKDGNKQNCVIENLQLITKKENMQRNSIMRFPKEVQEVIRLSGKLRRKINEQ